MPTTMFETIVIVRHLESKKKMGKLSSELTYKISRLC